jgi:hypothetical protein
MATRNSVKVSDRDSSINNATTDNIKNIINKIAPTENLDTSPKKQWEHLDLGTAIFVICIILFSILFGYIIPASSKIRYIAIIIALVVTFIFPLSWITSMIQYPNNNTKFYVLTCLFLGIVFEFVTLLLSVLTDQVIEKRAKEYNDKRTTEEIEKGIRYGESELIRKNNKLLYELFTATIVLMIGSVSVFFYDAVNNEKTLIEIGAPIKPASTMGTNIHWWLSFFYDKANKIDAWWHSTIGMFELPAIYKMFALFTIGFLTVFFIFVKITFPNRDTKTTSTDLAENPNDYKNETSLPNTKSPLKQNGVYLIPGQKAAPSNDPIVHVRYLPDNLYPENYDKIDVFGLFVFCISFLFFLAVSGIMTAINMYVKPLNGWINFFVGIISFIVPFITLFLVYSDDSKQKDLRINKGMFMLFAILFLFTVTISILAGPVVYMVIDMFLSWSNTSISSITRGFGWLVMLLLMVTVGLIFYYEGKPASNMLSEKARTIGDLAGNSNTFQLFAAILISLTVGWFLGLSFHYNMISLLFVLAFTPMKYALKWFGPIAILVLSIYQIIIASNSANRTGKVTDGFSTLRFLFS